MPSAGGAAGADQCGRAATQADRQVAASAGAVAGRHRRHARGRWQSAAQAAAHIASDLGTADRDGGDRRRGHGPAVRAQTSAGAVRSERDDGAAAPRARQEAEVDVSGPLVEFPDAREKVFFFHMRACGSGKSFHWPLHSLTQQAFLEAHTIAFEHFGGVFDVIRYDNLTQAVRKVLRGRKRLECERFTLLRSHYRFTADFCQPGLRGAHEKARWSVSTAPCSTSGPTPASIDPTRLAHRPEP
jgi:hypothetical protein